MRAVLGIDAAWTLAQPSGVAAAVEMHGAWRLIAVESSYRNFCASANKEIQYEERPSGASPNATDLLASAAMLCGCKIDLVAIDMPLSHSPIVGRRASDDQVSRVYGGRQCGTHSPNATRPGRISDELRASFELKGYPLLTDALKSPGLIEVYPHPALVELSNAPKRLPYKVSKVRNYWPLATSQQRRAYLYQRWSEIVDLLERRIIGVAAALSPLAQPAGGWQMKAYEDKLDAIICAWVAICCLNGQAIPLGDNDSAIWIPRTIVR